MALGFTLHAVLQHAWAAARCVVSLPCWLGLAVPILLFCVMLCLGCCIAGVDSLGVQIGCRRSHR